MLKTQKISILWMKEQRLWLKLPSLNTPKCRLSQFYRLYDKLLSGGVGEENLVLKNFKFRKFSHSLPTFSLNFSTLKGDQYLVKLIASLDV